MTDTLAHTTRQALRPLRRPATSLWRATLWHADSPVNLAVLRITVCVTLFGGAAYAALFSRTLPPSDTPTVAPELLGGLLAHLPRDAMSLRLVAAGLAVSALLGALGLWTRYTMAALALFATYHLGVPQIFGKVDHNHHVLWVLFVLAVAPCGDALSFDRWNRPHPQASVRYGFPLRVTWLMLGLAYFFPGFWKFRLVGLEWASASNMSNLMWNEWVARRGYEPVLDLTGQPWLLELGGVLTILIEIGFVFLVFWPKTRSLAIVGALGFHLGVGLTIGIWFTGLLFYYVAFVDWSRFLDPTGTNETQTLGPRDDPPSPLRTAAPLALTAFVLLAGMGRTINGWPVASYPDFAYRYGSVIESVDLVTARDDMVTDLALAELGEIERHRLLRRAWHSETVRATLQTLVSESTVCRDDLTTRVSLVHREWRVQGGALQPDPDPETEDLLSCG